MQVIFRKRATNYRALLRKMTYKDKASCGSSPPCSGRISEVLSEEKVMCGEGGRGVSIVYSHTLQHTVTPCNALQHTATHSGVGDVWGRGLPFCFPRSHTRTQRTPRLPTFTHMCARAHTHRSYANTTHGHTLTPHYR